MIFGFNGGFAKRKRIIFTLNGGFSKRKRVVFRLNVGFSKRKRVVFGFVRDYSFISLTQSLLRNKSRQVLGKGRGIFCLEDTDGQVLS